jgi:hypothetical protein
MPSMLLPNDVWDSDVIPESTVWSKASMTALTIAPRAAGGAQVKQESSSKDAKAKRSLDSEVGNDMVKSPFEVGLR